MKLKSIKIKNYRSIKDVVFDIKVLADKSCTYGLIGINEAGKSSILKAIALKDSLSDKKGPLPRLKDFRKGLSIETMYIYNPEADEIDELKKTLNDNFPDVGIIPSHFEEIILKFSFNKDNPALVVSDLDLSRLPLNDRDDVKQLIKQHLVNRMHKTIFWTAEDRYLITEPINITDFSNDPAISIPLWNCFSLVGLKSKEEIQSRISQVNADSTEKEQLQNELGAKVTEHINKAWPGHEIKITFLISDGLINFHVYDLNATSEKAKTVDQRSDGFGQFVSFLLSIGAQNKNEELQNTIVLIDEPETHLYPQAQEDMLRQLVELTQNNRNNILFFATHSNYLIDKNDLSRNYKVSKPDGATKLERFREGASTYASVSYEVFGILSSDFHNQLYDLLRAKYENKVQKANVQQLEFDNVFFQQEKKLSAKFKHKNAANKVTLPTYIRNCIHYPKNKGEDFEEKLRESIELLRSYEK